MCGIIGFLGPRNDELLGRMFEGIRHRGPDQEGAYQDDHCSFSHARLSIIDLSERGRQPMRSPDGRWIIAYNGEIYNYRALRERYEKEGWVFQSTSDTECLLASAALHGLDDLETFHGIFAVTIWDAKDRVLYVARDRMGIKPLFIANVDGRMAFASELPALLPLRSRWRVNRASRSAYLALGYVPGPATIVEGIESIEPGILLTVTADDLRSTAKKFSPIPRPIAFNATTPHRVQRDHAPSRSTRPRPSFDEAVQRVRTLVDTAVASQLVSDRPIGVFLSGGLDSTVVLSAMRTAQPGANIRTFTTRFAHDTDDPKFNRDAEVARRVANQYGCEHTEVTVTGEDVLHESESMAHALGQPHANHSIIALHKLSELARQHVPVVLSGDGGDESFGGYERYRLLAKWGRLLASPLARRALDVGIRVGACKREWSDLASASTEARRMLFFYAAPSSIRRSLFPGAYDDTGVLDAWSRFLDSIPSRSVADRCMALDRMAWLRDDAFVRSDRLTMRHGLELRVPLTDDAIVTFAQSLPSSFHVNGSETKRLWRAAFADRLPPEVAGEPKRGWFPPTAKWLRTSLRAWAEELLEEAIAQHSWINGPAVRRAFADHLERRSYHLLEVQTIIGYQLWWRAFGEYMEE